MQLFNARKFWLSAQFLQRTSTVHYQRPLLWLRLAQCCVELSQVGVFIFCARYVTYFIDITCVPVSQSDMGGQKVDPPTHSHDDDAIRAITLPDDPNVQLPRSHFSLDYAFKYVWS